jgi:hypothetical protein
MVCDGQKTPKTIIGNVETISLSITSAPFFSISPQAELQMTLSLQTWLESKTKVPYA